MVVALASSIRCIDIKPFADEDRPTGTRKSIQHPFELGRASGVSLALCRPGELLAPGKFARQGGSV